MYWQKPGQVFWGSLGCASYQAMALVPHFAPGGLLEHGVLGRPVDGDLWGSGAARRLCLRRIQVLVGSQEDHPPHTHTHRGWGPGAEEELGGSPSPPNHTHTEGGVQVLVRSWEDTPRPDTHTHTGGGVQVLRRSWEEHSPTSTQRGWGPGADKELGGSPPPPTHTYTHRHTHRAWGLGADGEPGGPAGAERPLLVHRHGTPCAGHRDEGRKHPHPLGASRLGELRCGWGEKLSHEAVA